MGEDERLAARREETQAMLHGRLQDHLNRVLEGRVEQSDFFTRLGSQQGISLSSDIASIKDKVSDEELMQAINTFVEDLTGEKNAFEKLEKNLRETYEKQLHRKAGLTSVLIPDPHRNQMPVTLNTKIPNIVIGIEVLKSPGVYFNTTDFYFAKPRV